MDNEKDKKQLITDMGRQFSDITILMHEAIAKDSGLPGTDHKYLGKILQNGRMTAGELAEITGLTTGAVTGLIDRFEKKLLVKRVYDKDDRRKVFIEPNIENASNLLGTVFSDIQKRILIMLSSFSDNELEIIEKYILLSMELMKDVTKNLNSIDKLKEKVS